MGAGIEAKGAGRAEIVAVLAIPHKRVGNDEMRVGIADGANRVPTRWGSEFEIVLIGAYQHVAVVGAAAAVVDAEWVVNGDGAAGCSAEGCGF